MGSDDGLTLSTDDGLALGSEVGRRVGAKAVGTSTGAAEVTDEGSRVGWLVGCDEGSSVGAGVDMTIDGLALGRLDG